MNNLNPHLTDLTYLTKEEKLEKIKQHFHGDIHKLKIVEPLLDHIFFLSKNRRFEYKFKTKDSKILSLTVHLGDMLISHIPTLSKRIKKENNNFIILYNCLSGEHISDTISFCKMSISERLPMYQLKLDRRKKINDLLN